MSASSASTAASTSSERACFGLLEHVGWDLTNHQLVIRVIIVGVSLHVNEVDDAIDIFQNQSASALARHVW